VLVDTIINVAERGGAGREGGGGRAAGDMHAPTNMLVSETSELGDTNERASGRTDGRADEGSVSRTSLRPRRVRRDCERTDDGLIAGVAPSGRRPISPGGPRRPVGSPAPREGDDDGLADSGGRGGGRRTSGSGGASKSNLGRPTAAHITLHLNYL